MLEFTTHRRTEPGVMGHRRNVYAVTVASFDDALEACRYLETACGFPCVEIMMRRDGPTTIEVMRQDGITTSHPLPAQMTRSGEFVRADPM